MPVPFGFSVGDFIAVVGIFRDVGTALRATGGASDDYLHIAQELESIAAVLQTLQSTPDITEGTTYANAIRDQAQASHQLLLKFLRRIEKYEASLGLGTHRGFRHGAASAKWALMVSKDLNNLRQEINTSTLSLRLLQNLHNMNLIKSIIRQGETMQREVSTRIDQIEGLERIVTSVSCTLDTRHQQILDLMHKIETRNEAQHHSLLDQINEIKAASTQSINHSTSFNFNQNLTGGITQPNTLNLRRTSFLELKLLVQGISADFLRLLSSMIGFLRKLFMLSPQVLAFLYILHNLPAQIGNFLSDDIHLEDALGERHRLQYQYFRSWEVLKTMLTVQFRGKPGEVKVAMGNFRILNARFQDIILDENNWSTNIKLGMRLIMSIEITKLRKPPKQGRCIRTGCLGVMSKLPRSAKISCPICGFGYFTGSRAPIIKVFNSSERSIKQKDFIAEVEETRRMLERMKAKASRMRMINPSGVSQNKRNEILKDLETISLEVEEQELENIRLQRRHRRQQQHITQRSSDKKDTSTESQEERELMVFKRIHISEDVWTQAVSRRTFNTDFDETTIPVFKDISNPNHNLHDMIIKGETPSVLQRINENFQQGSDIDSEDPCFGTPLQISAARGSIELVTLLLELGADPLKASSAWRDAFQAATEKGHRDVLLLILYTTDRRLASLEGGEALEAEVNFVNAVKQALHTATLKRRYEFVSLLLRFYTAPEYFLSPLAEVLDKELINIHVKEAVRSRQITAERGADIILNSSGLLKGEYLFGIHSSRLSTTSLLPGVHYYDYGPDRQI